MKAVLILLNALQVLLERTGSGMKELAHGIILENLHHPDTKYILPAVIMTKIIRLIISITPTRTHQHLCITTALSARLYLFVVCRSHTVLLQVWNN